MDLEWKTKKNYIVLKALLDQVALKHLRNLFISRYNTGLGPFVQGRYRGRLWENSPEFGAQLLKIIDDAQAERDKEKDNGDGIKSNRGSKFEIQSHQRQAINHGNIDYWDLTLLRLVLAKMEYLPDLSQPQVSKLLSQKQRKEILKIQRQNKQIGTMVNVRNEVVHKYSAHEKISEADFNRLWGMTRSALLDLGVSPEEIKNIECPKYPLFNIKYGSQNHTNPRIINSENAQSCPKARPSSSQGEETGNSSRHELGQRCASSSSQAGAQNVQVSDPIEPPRSGHTEVTIPAAQNKNNNSSSCSSSGESRDIERTPSSGQNLDHEALLRSRNSTDYPSPALTWFLNVLGFVWMIHGAALFVISVGLFQMVEEKSFRDQDSLRGYDTIWKILLAIAMNIGALRFSFPFYCCVLTSFMGESDRQSWFLVTYIKVMYVITVIGLGIVFIWLMATNFQGFIVHGGSLGNGVGVKLLLGLLGFEPLLGLASLIIFFYYWCILKCVQTN